MRNHKKHSQKREKILGKGISGKAHVASGAFWFRRGDFSNDLLLGEDKFTTQPQYGLSLSTLHKLDKQARKECKIPIFTVGFVSDQVETTYVIVNKKYTVVTEPTLVPSMKTSSKRIILTKDILKKWYLDTLSDICGIIYFTDKENKILETYYIIPWKTFQESYKTLFEGNK